MQTRTRILVSAAVLAGFSGLETFAEDMTITTYYPSPRGVYHELRTTGETLLAQQDGRVGIGTSTPGEKLEVNGGVRLNPAAGAGQTPACNADRRGTLWFARDVGVEGGQVDRLEFCASVYGRYRWVAVNVALSS